MSLHPFFQQTLSGQEESKPFDIPPQQLRHHIDAALAQMFAEFQWQTKQRVEIRDVLIATDFGEVRTRFYIPHEVTQQALPLYIHLHGGGWWLGTLDSVDDFLKKLCNETPCIVASVEYSLSPEVSFPQAPEEIYQVIKSIQQNFPLDIECDAKQAGIGGNSAGGNLAAALCVMAKERKDIFLNCQWLDCPATDASCALPSYTSNATGYMLTADAMRQAWQWYLQDTDKNHRHASVLNADLSSLPPAMVVTAQFDPLCDDGRLYAQKMMRQGCDVRLFHYQGMVHGFMGYSHLTQSQNAYRELISFLRRYLWN